ncbi:MAG TPA: RDD family protein [Flavobacterium sp.]|nr:RDD family protein [Flavobacterium sp.]
MTQLSINTTQNVVIKFNAASVGERMLAGLIDLVIQFAYLQLVFNLIFSFFGFKQYLSTLDQWSEMAVYILFYLPVAFYSVVQEGFFEGRTIGKYIVKIKVVKIDGYQASFGDYFMRWVLRIIDFGTVVTGLILLITTKKTQRLGDIAAGTAVITLRNRVTIDSTILIEVEDDYRPQFPLVVRLSDNDMRIIKDTFESARRHADYRTLERLAEKIEQVCGFKNPLSTKEAFISTVMKDYNYYTQKM